MFILIQQKMNRNEEKKKDFIIAHRFTYKDRQWTNLYEYKFVACMNVQSS